MATTSTMGQEISRPLDDPADSLRFDLYVAVTALLFQFGAFLDGWAHNHGRVDNTFFTPWHAVLYGSFGIVGALLIGTQLWNINKGHSWGKALPRGYLLAVVGVLIFGFGGVADMFWHETFGIEVGVEALLSPSHLILAVGAFLIISAPLRAVWVRGKRLSGWRDYLPVVLSAAMMLNFLGFFTQITYLNGHLRWLAGPRPEHTFENDLMGISGTLVTAGFIVGIMLLLLRRWKTLPFGTFTFIFALNGVLMVWMEGENNIEYIWVLAYALGGLLADTLLARWKPSAEQPQALWIIAAVMPFVTTLAFMGGIHIVGLQAMGGGLWWKIHMWLGAPFMAGFVGLLLSIVVFPPAVPEVVQD